MAKMRKFTPEITRMRELYGDDRQRMSKEMMDLYKREDQSIGRLYADSCANARLYRIVLGPARKC